MSAVACSHCGLPVPAGLVDPGRSHQFCCRGCRAVYQVIHGCGLERFYRLRAESSAAPRPAGTTDRKYGEFDDAVFRGLYYRRLEDGSQTVEFYLEGVHCAACVWLVEKLPKVLGGVIESRLDLRRAMVCVRWDESQVKLSQIAAMLDSLGYPPHPAKQRRSRELRLEEDRTFLIRIGVAAACAGNVMTLAFALYGGVFTGIEAPISNLFRWYSMLIGLISLIWPGSVFFRGAWAALRTRTAQLDLPIALGLAAGGSAGTLNTLLGRGEIYFDSLTVLVLLLLIGRWLQQRQQRWAADSLELLFSLTPSSARRREGERVVDVPIEAIQLDDVVEVRAGESIPVDGVVLEGESTVDRALLTGESLPVAVAPDAAVDAGTVNLGSRLVVRVRAVGEQTRVGRLMRLVEQSSRSRAPIVQLADRIAGHFVQVVIALALVTFALWMWREPSRAMDNAVALLIVTCPCALGLAAPLAIAIALGRAARRGIVVKGGDSLEILGGRGTVFVDKTGTITAGRTSIAEWTGDRALRPLVAALERHSSHPIARALVASVEGDPTDSSRLCAAHVEQVLGGGIVGTVDGRRLMVGSPRFMQGRGVSIAEPMAAAQAAAIAGGATPVLVAVDRRCEAVVSLVDPVRPDVPEALALLRKLGWSVRILSGDHPDLVAGLGARLGIEAADARGGLSPEDKLATVRQAAGKETAVMVGDGVNDAAALSAASVGIAVYGGAEASLTAAHVYLGRPGLTPIVELMLAARATLRAIRRCFAASLCYNLLTGSLALLGIISPWLAAILMPLSSFTVLALAYSARTFQDPP